MANPITGINVNPLYFDDLANSLANLSSYFGENGADIGVIYKDYKRLFNQAMETPPNYHEVTELTGEGNQANDRNPGRGAWLFKNLFNHDIQAVHSEIGISLLRFIARKVGCEIAVPLDDLQETIRSLNKTKKRSPKLGILGIKGDEVFVTQATPCGSLSKKADGLFPTRLFDDPTLKDTALRALHIGLWTVRTAFPALKVTPWVLVTHKEQPRHFEIHSPRVNRKIPESIRLTEETLVDTSINYQDMIDADEDKLWQLPRQLQNPLFKGLPPCRGGRTLGTLAAIARRQLEEQELIEWRECEVGELYRSTFNFEVTRDKIRHDIDDRLIAQWFMKPRGSLRYLTVFGMSRYMYCLAKYTNQGLDDPDKVLNLCMEHAGKIRAKYS